MSNYLLEIEKEFSRGRGQSSRLSPMDWNLGQTLENDGVPLHIILRVMSDGFKKFNGSNPNRSINSLRYFEQEIYKEFADWQTSQIGKAPEPISRVMPFSEETTMQNSTATAYSNPAVEILDQLATTLMPYSFARRNITLPDALRSTVAALRGEILALLDDATQKNLSLDKIEAQLTELRSELEVILIVSVSDDERARIIGEVKTEYAGYTLMEDIEKRAMIRKLYQKFGLPELSLFAI